MPRPLHRLKTGYTILVVDDQEEVLISVRHLLEREGHDVLTAASGEEALTALRDTHVDLLLVDYIMPRMTGEDLIREVRRRDPYVQIVLQTAYSGEKPPRKMLEELDIQGYHDKADGPAALLLWVQAGLRAAAVVRDLRERERRQEELVVNVSHELRNPISVMGGYTELLLDGTFGQMPRDARTPLRAVAASAITLNELVGNFLAYAKLEAHAMCLAPQPVSVEEIAADLDDLAVFLLGDKDVRFFVDTTRAPATAMVDSAKVHAILRNLLTNAVKFTASGTIELCIAHEGDTLRFLLRDTGSGIPAEARELIFESFLQNEGSSAHQPGGVGLGLALSRKMARFMGGDLEVESEPGTGSTFTLTVPVSPAPDRAERRLRLVQA